MNHLILFLLILPLFGITKMANAVTTTIPDICLAITEQHPLPIKSIAIYPPTSMIVLLLQDNFVQLVPLANLDTKKQTLSLKGTFPVKWFTVNWLQANTGVRHKDGPVEAQLVNLAILPKSCPVDRDYPGLTLHYQFHQSGGKSTVITSFTIFQHEQQRFRSDFIYFSQKNYSVLVDSSAADCFGYYFIIRTIQKMMTSKETFIVAEDLKDIFVFHKPEDFVLIHKRNDPKDTFIWRAFDNFSKAKNSNEDLLLHEQLPLGFLHQGKVYLLGRRSSSVFVFNYTKLVKNSTSPPIQRFIAQMGLSDFFQCHIHPESTVNSLEPVLVSNMTIKLTILFFSLVALVGLIWLTCYLVVILRTPELSQAKRHSKQMRHSPTTTTTTKSHRTLKQQANLTAKSRFSKGTTTISSTSPNSRVKFSNSKIKAGGGSRMKKTKMIWPLAK